MTWVGGTPPGLEGRSGFILPDTCGTHPVVYSSWSPPTGPTRPRRSLDPPSGQDHSSLCLQTVVCAPALVSLVRCLGPELYLTPLPYPPGGCCWDSSSPTRAMPAWVGMEGGLAPENLNAQGPFSWPQVRPPSPTQPQYWLSPAAFQQVLWPWCPWGHIPSQVPCGGQGHVYHQCRT